MADFDNVDEAVENLRDREGTITDRIGFVTIPDCTSRCLAEPGMLERVAGLGKREGA